MLDYAKYTLSGRIPLTHPSVEMAGASNKGRLAHYYSLLPLRVIWVLIR